MISAFTEMWKLFYSRQNPPRDNNKHIPVVETSILSAQLPDIDCEALEMELNLIRACKGNGNMEQFESYLESLRMYV